MTLETNSNHSNQSKDNNSSQTENQYKDYKDDEDNEELNNSKIDEDIMNLDDNQQNQDKTNKKYVNTIELNKNNIDETNINHKTDTINSNLAISNSDSITNLSPLELESPEDDIPTSNSSETFHPSEYSGIPNTINKKKTKLYMLIALLFKNYWIFRSSLTYVFLGLIIPLLTSIVLGIVFFSLYETESVIESPFVYDLGRISNTDIFRMKLNAEIGWIFSDSTNSQKDPLQMYNDNTNDLEKRQKIRELFERMKKFTEIGVTLTDIEFSNFHDFRTYASRNETLILGGYYFENIPSGNNIKSNIRANKNKCEINVNNNDIHNLNFDDNEWKIRILYFGQKHHMKLPILQQILIHSLQSMQVNDFTNPDYRIYYQEFPKSSIASIVFVQIAPYILTMGITALIPLFAQLITGEREKELKLQLRLFGVKKSTYWITRFISDFSLYSFSFIVQFITIGLIGRTPALIQDQHPLICVILYICYGFVFIPFTYIISFLFSKEKDVSKWCGLTISLIVSFTYIVVTLFMNNDLPYSIHYALAFIPTYSLYFGLTILGLSMVDVDPITLKQIVTFSGYGQHISVLFIILFFESFLFFGIIFFIEFIYHKLHSPSSWFNSYHEYLLNWEKEHRNQELDPSVMEEAKNANEGDYPLRAVQLHKLYKVRDSSVLNHAVKNVSFKSEDGEIFSLIGKNGAGKTSILEMITGKTPQNKGSIYINGYDLYKNTEKAYESMGVVAQENRLWEQLTCYQHIWIFSMLRGIINRSYIRKVLEEYDLMEHRNKKVKHLSGGNKRKLSVALAFLGNPRVVFLDEPTSAMDTSARNQLWNKLNHLKKGRVIVITSHSMEEIERADRIAILVNGELQCVDSISALKSRFQVGYKIAITIKNFSYVLRAQLAIETYFGEDIVLVNKVNDSLQYDFHGTIQLSELFARFESWKEELFIEDYSISQATLEKLFIQMTSNQE